MPTRKHDRETLIVEYLTARTLEPALTVKAWCARTGKSYNTMKHLISPHVASAWDDVMAKARAEAEKKLGGNLGRKVGAMLDRHIDLLNQNLDRILVKNGASSKIVDQTILKPEDFTDAVRAVHVASRAIVAASLVLTGRTALAPQGEQVSEEGIDWVKPSRNSRKPRKRRR